jgi:REP element-mobilizing transposase RayT
VVAKAHFQIATKDIRIKGGHKMATKQFSFFKSQSKFHGGSLLHGRRRSLRPLSTKDPIHIVMRSSWAYGSNSFILDKNRKVIYRLIGKISKCYFIKVYRLAVVSNHLHLIIRISKRRNYHTFIRVLSSQIASQVIRSTSFLVFKETLNPVRGCRTADRQFEKALSEIQDLGQAFWQFRPFSRVISWGRDFNSCCQYLLKNTLEAVGFISYQERKTSIQKYKVSRTE